MEHLRHFGLARDPFRNDPQRRFYFGSRQHREAERRLLRGIRQGKGLSVLLGPVGSGKTTLVRHILEQLDERRFEAGLLVLIQGACDTDWLLQRVARQIGIERLAPRRAELLGQIYTRLAQIRRAGRRTVILVDEAQMLDRREVLVELRGLLNLELDEERLLSMVLTGLPELEQALHLDAPLADRVEIRVTLSRLDAGSASAYLAHRIRQAGGDPGILEPEAAAAIARFAGGVPRRMNTLADNALFEAYLAGRAAAQAADVEAAAYELGWSPEATGGSGPAEVLEPAGMSETDAGAELPSEERRAARVEAAGATAPTADRPAESEPLPSPPVEPPGLLDPSAPAQLRPLAEAADAAEPGAAAKPVESAEPQASPEAADAGEPFPPVEPPPGAPSFSSLASAGLESAPPSPVASSAEAGVARATVLQDDDDSTEPEITLTEQMVEPDPEGLHAVSDDEPSLGDQVAAVLDGPPRETLGSADESTDPTQPGPLSQPPGSAAAPAEVPESCDPAAADPEAKPDEEDAELEAFFGRLMDEP